MQVVLGEILPLGVAVALSPLPIIAVLLLLVAPVGVRGALLFLAARAVTLCALVVIFALASDLADDAAGSATPAAILRIVVGSALLVGAVMKWRTRPRGADEPKLPGWMRSVDNAGPAHAVRLGFLLTAANVKEIAFAAGIGFTIGGAFLPWGQIAIAVAVFVVLACLSIAIPVAAALVGGDRVRPALAEMRNWLVRNNAIVVAIVLLVLGAMLVGSGITEL
ncbi:hypothetical protein IWX78_000523 [Mycetocola sp. CAN_C7]|uniref:GAP family protein n=1 Tax=Mycetocola sp. CAN_C7 TaxID=2787724 RepID=UPI0018C911F9